MSFIAWCWTNFKPQTVAAGYWAINVGSFSFSISRNDRCFFFCFYNLHIYGENHDDGMKSSYREIEIFPQFIVNLICPKFHRFPAAAQQKRTITETYIIMLNFSPCGSLYLYALPKRAKKEGKEAKVSPKYVKEISVRELLYIIHCLTNPLIYLMTPWRTWTLNSGLNELKWLKVAQPREATTVVAKVQIKMYLKIIYKFWSFKCNYIQLHLAEYY